ncbi:hypothetical protein [Desulfolutivibrio sp.]|uniref:hypothetical protein n=1 Tax=Desulfolutivibrio sp. TaxID=2773296 RepID=UPI002F960B63
MVATLQDLHNASALFRATSAVSASAVARAWGEALAVVRAVNVASVQAESRSRTVSADSGSPVRSVRLKRATPGARSKGGTGSGIENANN